MHDKRMNKNTHMYSPMLKLGRVAKKSVRVVGPRLYDEPVRREAFERLQPPCKIVGAHEHVQMLPQGRQPTDSVSVQTAMRRGAPRKMPDRLLQGVQAVVKEERGVFADGGDHCLFPSGWTSELGSHRKIAGGFPFPPFGHRFGVYAVTPRQNP